jgi:hypothetical protein
MTTTSSKIFIIFNQTATTIAYHVRIVVYGTQPIRDLLKDAANGPLGDKIPCGELNVSRILTVTGVDLVYRAEVSVRSSCIKTFL